MVTLLTHESTHSSWRVPHIQAGSHSGRTHNLTQEPKQINSSDAWHGTYRLCAPSAFLLTARLFATTNVAPGGRTTSAARTYGTPHVVFIACSLHAHSFFIVHSLFIAHYWSSRAFFLFLYERLDNECVSIVFEQWCRPPCSRCFWLWDTTKGLHLEGRDSVGRTPPLSLLGCWTTGLQGTLANIGGCSSGAPGRWVQPLNTQPSIPQMHREEGPTAARARTDCTIRSYMHVGGQLPSAQSILRNETSAAYKYLIRSGQIILDQIRSTIKTGAHQANNQKHGL